MITVEVNLADRTYPIYIGQTLLANAGLIVKHLPQKRVAIVTNETIAPFYLSPLRTALEAQGVSVLPIVVPDGESFKTWETLNSVFDQLLRARCERKTTLIALGGGVVGDLTGFAAAVYLRGVPFIQIPTTLLAQVDSSVGGKTAVNHPLGKNMIGAFYQPAAVIADTATLSTLPARELSAGLAEVIKYGLIMDLEFLAWLEQNVEAIRACEPRATAHAVRRSCECKAKIVAADERETGVRAYLNLGHTFGHAIEAGLGFGTWLHGEAVAAGMVLAARTSSALGHITMSDVNRASRLLERAGCPTNAPDFPVQQWLEHMGHDKKVQDGKLRFVLLRRLGEAYVDDAVPQAVLNAVLAQQDARA